jgi:hypothetical protein
MSDSKRSVMLGGCADMAMCLYVRHLAVRLQVSCSRSGCHCQGQAALCGRCLTWQVGT